MNSPVTEHILERQGAPLHYWIEGPEDCPVVICTHGATVDHRMFVAQLSALTPKYRVLTWDVRGHGLSRPLGTRFSFDDCIDDLLAIMQHSLNNALYNVVIGKYVNIFAVADHQPAYPVPAFRQCQCVGRPFQADRLVQSQ